MSVFFSSSSIKEQKQCSLTMLEIVFIDFRVEGLTIPFVDFFPSFFEL